jgi:hypothetical protein
MEIFKWRFNQKNFIIFSQYTPPAKKHVLCEKPLTLHLEETEKLYQLSKKHQVFFMEAIWSRCFPAYHRIKEEIEKGTIGEVRLRFGAFLLVTCKIREGDG